MTTDGSDRMDGGPAGRDRQPDAGAGAHSRRSLPDGAALALRRRRPAAHLRGGPRALGSRQAHRPGDGGGGLRHGGLHQADRGMYGRDADGGQLPGMAGDLQELRADRGAADGGHQDSQRGRHRGRCAGSLRAHGRAAPRDRDRRGSEPHGADRRLPGPDAGSHAAGLSQLGHGEAGQGPERVAREVRHPRGRFFGGQDGPGAAVCLPHREHRQARRVLLNRDGQGKPHRPAHGREADRGDPAPDHQGEEAHGGRLPAGRRGRDAERRRAASDPAEVRYHPRDPGADAGAEVRGDLRRLRPADRRAGPGTVGRGDRDLHEPAPDGAAAGGHGGGPEPDHPGGQRPESGADERRPARIAAAEAGRGRDHDPLPFHG